jgi:hypothetical protein
VGADPPRAAALAGREQLTDDLGLPRDAEKLVQQ